MKIVIQKFGGTSVSTKENREKVMEKVKESIDNGYSPVVVVSAMGRKGSPYATDTLLSLVNENFIKENKLAADLLMCCGEIISSVVMSSDMNSKNIEAFPMTGGQAGLITNKNFGEATLISTNEKEILDVISQGRVPVVTGFQGITENGYFTTLGRGGSDTTASILGVMLDAERIEIYTDVDGVMTADPRIVKSASVIDIISYDEVFQLADQGSKVIHPRAVEYAREGNIPIMIKNTLNDTIGTLINSVGDRKRRRLITSITNHDDRIQVTINLDDNKGNDRYNDVLEILAANKISLDLINIFPRQQVFTISKAAKDIVKDIFGKLDLKYTLIDNCSTIALVGAGMKGIPGVMAKIYKTLSESNIEVLQTADSHMTIWCLIHTENLEKAINALHKAFKL